MTSERRAPIRVGFYDIEKTIGKGNFAVVKLARHRLTKTEVAIKIIDKTQLAAADLKRAYREVRVLKKLHHPHIIRLYQVMETKNMLYIVSEYAPKGEVFEHIARHGRLPEPAARRLYWQVVSAVDYCHKRGVVHRDLKAENLLLDVEGCVKLADFGFSTWWCPESKLATWCGSPPYAAPEVFEGRQYTGPEVDVWSLGVVLYVFVCGALPFDASTLPVLRDRVLSARYRIPYFMSAECESLVRRMLVKDPGRRNTIEQVKRHCWMQGDGPPRLLPSPFHNAAENTNTKQYMDPGIVPDVYTEPNEQILRLMASLGIDSPRTRESLRQQRYDHHCAIYFLLLERLRQNGPGCPRDNVSGPPGRSNMGTVRMFSTDSSTYHRNPRRPSSIAEHAMRKMQPGTSSEAQLQQMLLAQQTANTTGTFREPSLTRRISSHTTSVDEGVADLDSLWDAELSGSLGMVGQGTSINSVVTNPALRSRCDWKLPTRGSTGSSNQISIDLSQTSGSPGESVCGSGSTLSSWDSAWEPGGLAASLPSCTAASSVGATDERRISLTNAETPLSPSANLTDGSLWAPTTTQPPGSPIEFRLGRRASDGFMGKTHAPFARKLEGTRAGGVVALAETTQMQSDYAGISGEVEEEETYFDQPLVSDNAHLCSPQKRPSLPVSWKPLPMTWSPPEPYLPQWTGSEGPGSSSGSTSSASHLHRKMMAIRLNRKTAIAEHSDFTTSMDEAGVNVRKPVLRQQSYKLAQQQTVLPPLPLRNNFQDMCLGMENRGTFRPITEEEFTHSAQDEDEEGEESDTLEPIGSIVRDRIIEKSWKNLPVTMSECKLTDSNGSLSRLSLLLHVDLATKSHPSSPVPRQWDQANFECIPVAQLQSSDGSAMSHQDRMDTSGS